MAALAPPLRLLMSVKWQGLNLWGFPMRDSCSRSLAQLNPYACTLPPPRTRKGATTTAWFALNKAYDRKVAAVQNFSCSPISLPPINPKAFSAIFTGIIFNVMSHVSDRQELLYSIFSLYCKIYCDIYIWQAPSKPKY